MIKFQCLCLSTVQLNSVYDQPHRFQGSCSGCHRRWDLTDVATESLITLSKAPRKGSLNGLGTLVE